ncbi:hypothetical protein W04_0810 [Pseudoalteromonas sp. SW0106-04]|nr:hypothetical protein W04_0810 [Pseudoalteromonas sp. SW0106-04]|tara:strand:- start:5124 stop:5237 length:114 start_codon:yes stop_codon:yes gene_type:complete
MAIMAVFIGGETMNNLVLIKAFIYDRFYFVTSKINLL